METQKSNDNLSEQTAEVNFALSETDQFLTWFSQLDTRVAVKINGNLYRFNTEQEKANFSYGLSLFYRQNKVNRNKIDKLKSELKSSEKKITSFFQKILN